MYYQNSQLLFSPSDLNTYLESEFASWMTRFELQCRETGVEPMLPLESLGVAGVLVSKRDDRTEDDISLQKRGQVHESMWLSALRKSGRIVTTISADNHELLAQQTHAAMKAGDDVIYQAYLYHPPFGGYADFLIKVDGESKLGSWHYEVADTKLARSTKAYFLLQLCCYSDLLDRIQGVRPDRIRVILGDNSEAVYPTDAFFHYYQTLRRSFEHYHTEFDPKAVPHPYSSTTFGQWSEVAKDILERMDHLSRVARITRHQIKKLTDAGIETRDKLAKTNRKSVAGIDEAAFQRLRHQAQLQIESKIGEPPLFVVVPPPLETPRRGLAILPPASELDVFFDMEGYPHAEGGLEYLFGATMICKGGTFEFADWWAHDHVQERRAFEAFIDWAFKRWKKDPSMHIYHYAAYETTAVKRLAQQYATREHEVDEFLRHGVFVDIYTVVRQGMIVGTPSYSLKDIEHIYRPPRRTDVKTAAGSVVAYEKWMDAGESQEWQKSPILGEIRDYNRDDCDSLAELCLWLWLQQKKSGILFVAAEDPAGDKSDDATPKHQSKQLADRILASLGPDPSQWDANEKLLGLKAHLLEFHWRESKPVYWRMFNWAGKTEDELAEDFECLAGLRRTESAPKLIKKTMAVEYQFAPEQATKLGEGSKCLWAENLKCRSQILEFDAVEGRLWINTPKSIAMPDKLNLIPDELVTSHPIPAAVMRYVSASVDGKTLSRAVDDLLTRHPPRIKGRSGKPVIEDTGDLTAAVIEAVVKMDRSTLCIQGPPGTGKSHTSAHAIAELMRRGKSVGVMANSHKAILNLLRKVNEIVREERIQCQLVKIGGDAKDQMLAGTDIIFESGGKAIEEIAREKSIVVGATAWAFSRDAIEQAFDYLFVDEAGQVSLANLVAAGLSALNLVLVGDQMQLSQPIQGAHPGESGQSGFDYLLQGKATIPPEFGVFLDTTYRMNPSICRFISDAVYDGRLYAAPATKNHRIDTSGSKLLNKDSGVVFLPVEHEHNSQSSEEEAALIQKLVKDLLGREFVAKDGKKSKLTPEDLLIVAPFNLQVRELQLKLDKEFRIASVDKFQGQEAPVVIVSMCSSSLDDSPRGAEFLLSPNRLNVAVSRAQCMAVVVGSPRLALARCTSVEQMRLVNLFCWIMNHAACITPNS